MRPNLAEHARRHSRSRAGVGSCEVRCANCVTLSRDGHDSPLASRVLPAPRTASSYCLLQAVQLIAMIGRAGVAVARRVAAFAAGAVPEADTADAVRPLIAAHRRVFPGADAGLLRHAYAVAARWHEGQVRKSGAPHITHPLGVAILLADIGIDTTTLVAALLHDTVEDTGLTIGEVKAEFGAEVAVLVDGVTKLDGSKWGDHAEGETFRKMILAASIDLRVLVIKLADRGHTCSCSCRSPSGSGCMTTSASWRTWPSRRSRPRPTSASRRSSAGRRTS